MAEIHMRRRVKDAGIRQGVDPFVTGYPKSAAVAADVVETSYSSRHPTNEAKWAFPLRWEMMSERVR